MGVPARTNRAAKSPTDSSVLADVASIGRPWSGPGVLLFAFFISISNDAFFVVYGVFLENSYGFSLSALGLTVVIIGVAEIIAEMLTAWWRSIGFTPGSGIGHFGDNGAYLVLPFSGEQSFGVGAGKYFSGFSDL